MVVYNVRVPRKVMLLSAVKYVWCDVRSLWTSFVFCAFRTLL